jgi:Icc-related predicted phosphoesterase
MIRVAAIGDLHVVPATAGALRPIMADLPRRADLLLLAGDLTDHGRPDEAAVMCDELRDLGLPTVAILGNHDHEAGHPEVVTELLAAAGISVLDGDSVTVEVGDTKIGIGGTKGFGGGFAGTAVSRFGEPEMKAFADHAALQARRLGDALTTPAMRAADLRIALVHYSPVPATLAGESPELFPWLGSHLLATAIDEAGGIDLAVHGHAHYGCERGVTPGGTQVRNVAGPVVRAPYAVYTLPDAERAA